MCRKWITLAVCAVIPAGFAGEPSMTEIMRQLELLQKQVQQQQVVIDQLRGELTTQTRAASTEQVTDLVKQEVTAAMEQHALSASSSAPYLKLGSSIDGIALKGDLRLRYEYRDREDQDKSNRDRMRVRLRLGGVWTNSAEDWEVAVGLASGGDDPTSTNDTWSENRFFETGDIRLDYAYAKHNFKIGDAKLTATLGQHKNPFVGSWLLWDGDVCPAGISLQAEQAGLFATLGWYDVYNNGDEISEMLGGQLGYNHKSESFNATVALAYYLFEDSVWKDSGMGFGDNDMDFHIGDLYAAVGIPLGEKASATVYGDYFVNMGAEGGAGTGWHGDPNLDAEDGDTGWVAGVDVKVGSFSFGYCYASLDENAANPLLVDSDFGSGLDETDVEGHRIKAGYKLTKNCSIGILAQFAEAKERSNVGDVDLYQVDLSYKF